MFIAKLVTQLSISRFLFLVLLFVFLKMSSFLFMLCTNINKYSKKCYLLLICQSLSGLVAISNNNKDLVNSALSNFSYLCFLDCFSPDSAQMVIDYVGKYDKKNVSTTRNGNHTSTQTSFEEADILNKNDLIKLAGSDELILISRIGGYNMIKKIAAWSDDNFSYRLH